MWPERHDNKARAGALPYCPSAALPVVMLLQHAPLSWPLVAPLCSAWTALVSKETNAVGLLPAAVVPPT